MGATAEGLRVWQWEPARSLDYVDAGWGKVSDLGLHEGRLIGCSKQGQFVSLHVVDLTQ